MLSDLRYAFRQLVKTPGFTAVAVLTLALGIGANTAIFSVVNGVLLRPLPYPEQERLVSLSESSKQVPGMSISYPNFLSWTTRQNCFSTLGVSRGQSFNYNTGNSGTERLAGALVTHDLFSALGVSALRGRLFRADDDKPGAERTVVIRESLWRRLFGGRDSIIGEQVQLNGTFSRIIGILPDFIQYPNPQAEIWSPLGLLADQGPYPGRGNHPGLAGIARLRPGVTLEAAQAEMSRIGDQLAQEYPDTNAHQSVSVIRLTDQMFGPVRPMLYLLLGAAGFVLLIACANVASLQLARAQAREREFATRTALGASRGRVIRLLLLESTVLGLLGCLAGLVLGSWALSSLCAVLPSNFPRLADVNMNTCVFAFAGGISLLTSIVSGLVPAIQASNPNLRESLNCGARSAGGNRLRTALTVGEFALTFVLLVGAGLMLRTMSNLYRADPGFSTEHVVAFNWNMPGNAYSESTKRIALIERARVRLTTLPGVSSVGLINPAPLTGWGNQSTYYIKDTPPPEPGRQPSAERGQIDSDYFTTLNIPLVAGRTFNEHDTNTAPRVAIVDTMFVRKNFPAGVDPIGKYFVYDTKPPTKDSDWFQIVGVVAHIQNYGLGTATREQTYQPYTQNTPSFMAFLIRTERNPGTIMPLLRTAMREVSGDLPIFGTITLDEAFETSISSQRLTMALLGAFAVLALVVAALGLYGVISYYVGQRTREIGIRMALGATPRSVVDLVVRHGLRIAGLGLLLGLGVALALTGLLRNTLYGVSPFDPASFCAVALILTAIGILASYIPARRATRINPIVTLRAE